MPSKNPPSVLQRRVRFIMGRCIRMQLYLSPKCIRAILFKVSLEGFELSSELFGKLIAELLIMLFDLFCFLCPNVLIDLKDGSEGLDIEVLKACKLQVLGIF